MSRAEPGYFDCASVLELSQPPTGVTGGLSVSFAELLVVAIRPFPEQYDKLLVAAYS